MGTYSEVPAPLLLACLKFKVNLKCEETICQHWNTDLAQFQFSVIIADALSSASHLDDPTPEGNAENQIDN